MSHTLQGQLVTVDVVANDGPDPRSFHFVSATDPQHGRVACDANGLCSYLPDPAFVGTDEFTYLIANESGKSDTTTVTISVEPVPTPTPAPDHAPIVVGNVVTTRQTVAVTVDVLANDVDPDGDQLTVTAYSQSNNGAVTCAGVRPTLCTYTPGLEFVGNDSFTYTVSDGRGDTATGTVSITVLPPYLL